MLHSHETAKSATYKGLILQFSILDANGKVTENTVNQAYGKFRTCYSFLLSNR